MITLPKDWVESNNLKKNDPVQLQPRNGNLIIHSEMSGKDNPSLKEINVTEDGPFLFRQLLGAYISGYREIIINSKSGTISGDSANIIANFTQAAIGFEILEDDGKHILIRDLMNHKDMPHSKSIERMKVLVDTMLSDIQKSTATDDLTVLSKMENRDAEVDRINWLISRQANISLSEQARDNLLLTNVIIGRILERIGDHSVNISKNLLKIDGDPQQELIDVLIRDSMKDILTFYQSSIEGFINNDIHIAEECIEKSSCLVAGLKDKFQQSGDDFEFRMYSSPIVNSLRRIIEYCVDISEQTINKAMSPQGSI